MSQFMNAGRIPSLSLVFRHLLSSWSIRVFLFCGGTILVSLGAAGVIGVLGSVSNAQLFHPPQGINWLHLLFGIFVLLSAAVGTKGLQFGLALLGAIAGITLGTADFLLSMYSFLGTYVARFPDVSDPLTHLAVGTLAIWALRNNRRKEA